MSVGYPRHVTPYRYRLRFAPEPGIHRGREPLSWATRLTTYFGDRLLGGRIKHRQDDLVTGYGKRRHEVYR
jgi:hypothetical protein